MGMLSTKTVFEAEPEVRPAVSEVERSQPHAYHPCTTPTTSWELFRDKTGIEERTKEYGKERNRNSMANYKEYEALPLSESTPTLVGNEEEQSLLPTARRSQITSKRKASLGPVSLTGTIAHLRPTTTLLVGYVAGVLSVLLTLLLVHLCGTFSSDTPSTTNPDIPEHRYPPYVTNADKLVASFPADIGSTEVAHYPPASPTNDFPSLFPTKVGYPGSTATGAEPGLVMTAGKGMYPPWGGVEGLVRPPVWGQSSITTVDVGDHPGEEEEDRPVPEWIEDDVQVSPEGKKKKKTKKFDIFRHWGNLSPFHSVPPDSFGISSNTGPDVPASCALKAVHVLHRHGARYPTASGNAASYGVPSRLASKLHQAASSPTGIKAHGPLSFLNTWTYKLGAEVLTPFGRQELFDLGVSMRVKYGTLLDGLTERLPVFRTESQDRMLASATNFALGFFGWPLDNKFLLSVTIEEKNVNNTLAPYKSCPNDSKPALGGRGNYYVEKWVGVYLPEAQRRIQALLEGVELTLDDVYTMQMLCAYETVALGYSKFCELFTEEEWEGFEYALDLYFWYDSGFGSPVARALGSGYVLELLARLTQTPISPTTTTPSTFSVNLTLDTDPRTFPLDQPIYVDATHEVVIVNIATALNLTSLVGEPDEAMAAPSWRKMKRGRRWITSRIAPFASNMQFQLLECPDASLESLSLPSPSTTYVRVILNDAVVALTGVSGCPEQADGLCPADVFVDAQRRLIAGSDWDWTCHGNWTVPKGDAWRTFTGDPPAKP